MSPLTTSEVEQGARAGTEAKSASDTSSNIVQAAASVRMAAVDVGSNSIKVRIAETSPTGPRTIHDERFAVRLGKSVFSKGRLTADDVSATVKAFQKIRELCDGYHVNRSRVVATSASREAENREQMLSAVKTETGFEIEVISGAEEARLLALGIRPEMRTGASNLIVDIGGGSTEWIHTRPGLHIDAIHSLRIGAVRINEIVNPSNPMSARDYASVRRRIQSVLGREHLPRISRRTHVVGVAGTMRAISEMVGRMKSLPSMAFSFADLGLLIRNARGLTHEQISQTYKLEKRRAEIILVGALILRELMALHRLDSVHVSSKGLRDGLFEDLQQKQDPELGQYHEIALAIGEKYGFDRPHAETVSRIAVSLFDQLRPVLNIPHQHRETLIYAALLHDIGQFVSHSSHHKHSHYLIANENLPGLSRAQQEIAAHIARYHRKALPSDKHETFVALTPANRSVVSKLAAILRIANGLDRSHRQAVGDVLVQIGKDETRIFVSASGEISFELGSARDNAQLLAETLETQVTIKRTELVQESAA